MKQELLYDSNSISRLTFVTETLQFLLVYRGHEIKRKTRSIKFQKIVRSKYNYFHSKWPLSRQRYQMKKRVTHFCDVLDHIARSMNLNQHIYHEFMKKSLM